MLMRGPIRQFLKDHPEPSFAQKPKDRMMLKVVKHLNNDHRLRHYYSHWSRFLLEEHDVPRESDHSWHYEADIIFSHGHETLLKITKDTDPETGRVTYKVSNGSKPAMWMIKNYKFIGSIVDNNNRFYHTNERHHLKLTKPCDQVNYNNKYFTTGNPRHEPGHVYTADAMRLGHYCKVLIKTEIMIHNLGRIEGLTKGQVW